MLLRRVAGVIVILAFAFPAAASAHHRPARWVPVPTGSTQQHRGLDAVDKRTVWVSGTSGEVLRTTDGGRTWKNVSPPGAAALQFRDVEAESAERASVLAIGEGDASRIYRTTDGGRHWQLAFVNDDPAAFYDCVTFLDRRNGLALSDPVGGRFRILATHDGGRSWAVQPDAGMPDALPGEFAFAASGTCLVSADRFGGRRAWFATGGGERARVFATRNGGRTWTVADTPIPSGPSAGVYSLAFRDPWHGIAVGGDYVTPETAPAGSATSRDGGRTWVTSRTVPGEYRSGTDWVGAGPVALAVGPTGSDISYDGGRTWAEFDGGSFDAVICAPDRSCWASGEQGRVAKLRWGR